MTQIDRTHLADGVRLGLAQAREFFEAARLAADANLPNAAATNYGHALQEVGKAKMLGDALAAGSTQPDLKIYDHDAKFVAAELAIGSSGMWVRDPSLQPGAFQSNAFDVGVPASEDTRRRTGYLNYGSTGWHIPPQVSLSDLRGHIADVLTLLPSLETTLTEPTGGTP